MKKQLDALRQVTYDAVFKHPVARDLEWLEVRSMLVALADVVEQDSDVLKLKRKGKTLVLHRPYRKGLGDIEELMKVRRFLEQTDEAVGPPAGPKQQLREDDGLS